MKFAFPTASVLNDRPMVLAMYDSDFEKRYADLASALSSVGAPDASILLQLGFEHESEEPAAKLADSVKSFKALDPAARVIVLCNTPAEQSGLASRGLETVFCHQNALLDERRFRILPVKKRFDAVYLARIAPFKRHLLLEKIVSPRILLAGSNWYEHEREYVDDVKARLAEAVYIRTFRGLDASKVLCPAVCGLCLSAREGAMFASAEYMLCGLPLVNTPSVGGREQLFPADYFVNVEADSEAIAAGIAQWISNPPDPYAVRAAFLEKCEPHRETFRRLFAELSGGIPLGRIPHKLGLRTPPGGELRIRLGQLYLFLQSLLCRAS